MAANALHGTLNAGTEGGDGDMRDIDNLVKQLKNPDVESFSVGGVAAGPTAAGVTSVNVGTGAATSVVEYGDGFHHVTVLTATSLALPQPTGGSSLGVGDLVYTFPAGAVLLENAYMSLAFTVAAATKTDEADAGLGTVIATGAVSVLSGTGTFEDIITGQTSADVDGTDVLTVAPLPTAGVPLFIASGDAHTVHVNLASDWLDAEVAAHDLEYSGTVVLIWKFLE